MATFLGSRVTSGIPVKLPEVLRKQIAKVATSRATCCSCHPVTLSSTQHTSVQRMRLGVPSSLKRPRSLQFSNFSTLSSNNEKARELDPSDANQSTAITDAASHHARKNASSSLEERIHHILTDVPIGSMSPSMVTFCHGILDQVARRVAHHNHEHAETAERVLERLVQEQQACGKYEHVVIVTPTAYHRVIRCWQNCKSSSAEGASDKEVTPMDRIAKVFGRMQDRHTQSPTVHPAPDHYTYKNLLHACAIRSRNANEQDTAVTLAESVLRSLQFKADSTTDENSPFLTAQLYHSVLEIHANRAPSCYGAAAAAEDWLMRMSSSDSTNPGPPPDTPAFNRVLQAWRSSPEDKGADRALEILELLLRLSHDFGIQPDAVSFGTVIAAFGQRGRPHQAQAVFSKALHYFDTTNMVTPKDSSIPTEATTTTTTSVDPSEAEASTKVVVDLTMCLNAALTAWAKSGDPDAPHQSLALLEDARKIRLRQAGWTLNPNTVSYTACLQAHVVVAHVDWERAYKLLDSMIANGPTPNQTTFRVLMDGWRRSSRPDRASRATQLVHRQLTLERTRKDVAMERGSFEVCLGLWKDESSRQDAPTRALEILKLAQDRNLATDYGYQSVINMLCRSRNPQHALEAVQVLERYRGFVGESYKPHLVAGLSTAVLSALARVKTPEAAQQALRIFQSMRVEPTSRAFAAVLFAVAHMDEPGSTAFGLYGTIKMLDETRTSKVQLDMTIFAAVMEALAADSGSADRACRVLQDMLGLRERDLEPDTRCYNACLRAILKSKDPSYLAKGVELVKTLSLRYKDGSIKHLPSPGGVHSFLRRCASLRALETQAIEVVRLYNEIDYHSPSTRA